MSRSGYTDDDENNRAGLWRGAVRSAIKGKRGQAMLREVLAALDAMPEKALAAESLVTADGQFCTLGALGVARGIDTSQLDPEDPEQVAEAFDIAEALAREIVYENDDAVDTHFWMKVEVCGPMHQYSYGGFFRGQEHVRDIRVEKPVDVMNARRWKRMRKWVSGQLIEGSKA